MPSANQQNNFQKYETLRNDALSISFMVNPSKELLVIPDIARDPEHHWILAKASKKYLIEQTKKQGVTNIVISYKSRFSEDDLFEILKKLVLEGNLTYIIDIRKLFEMPMELVFRKKKYSLGQENQYVYNYTVIELAAINGHLNIVEYFTTNHKWSDRELNYAFLESVRQGHISVVKFLSPLCTDQSHNRAQVNAIEQKQNDVLKFLLTISGPAERALLESVYSNNPEAFKIVFANHSNLENERPFQRDMLNCASWRGYDEIVEILLDNFIAMNYDYDYLEENNLHILKQAKHIACISGYIRVVRVIDHYVMTRFHKEYICIDEDHLIEISAKGFSQIIEYLLPRQKFSQTMIRNSIEEAAKAQEIITKTDCKEYNFMKTIQELLLVRTYETLTHTDTCRIARHKYIWMSLQNAIYNAIYWNNEDIVIRLLEEPHLGFHFNDQHPNLSAKAQSKNMMKSYKILLDLEETCIV